MTSRLTRQPQQALPLDRNNPLGAKVIEHISLRGGASSVLGMPVTYGAGGSTVASTKGRSVRGAGAGGRASFPLNLSKYSVITVAFWLYWDAYANNDALAMEFGPLYGTNNGFIIDPNCSSPAAFMFGAGDSSNNNLLTFPRPSAGAWHRIVLTMDRAAAAGASGTAYVDGVAQPISAFPGATPVTGNFGVDTLHLFSRNESTLLGTGNLQDITFYRGALSSAEAAQDYQNPYQIFKARSSAYQAMLAPTATSTPVGNAYTMPAAQGWYAITGNAASLRAARILTASAGAYALAGNAAALRVSRRMAAAAGAYSITGSAAGLIKSTAPRALQVAAGSYTITGNPAALRAARRLQATPGAYAITGFAVADRVVPVVTISVRFNILPRNFNLKTIHFSN